MFENTHTHTHTIYGGYGFTHSDGIDKRSLSSILEANEWELHLLFEEQAAKTQSINITKRKTNAQEDLKEQ